MLNHGRHVVKASGTLLSIEAWGPWNREAALMFSEAVHGAVETMRAETWGQLACLYGEGLYTPESMPVLTELHTWRVDHGLRHIAIVHDRDAPEVAKVTEYQFNRIYTDSADKRCVTRYFYYVEDALSWLAEWGHQA